MLKHVGDKWCVYSEDGSKSLGCNPPGLKDEEAKKAWAHKRLAQVEYFKKHMEELPLEAEDKVLLLADEVLFDLADAYLEVEGSPVVFEAGEARLADAPSKGSDFPAGSGGVGPPGYQPPKNWTRASAEKYWQSVGGSVTACMTKLGGEKAAPFCASVKDYVTGKTDWRGPKKKEMGENIYHTAPLRLAEAETPTGADRWIDLLMTGEYTSMDGDPVEITSDKIAAYIGNFNEGVRGQDIPVTIDHPAQGGASAGWLKGVRSVARTIAGIPKTVMQGLVKWTPLGQDKTGSGEYRYVSAELMGDILRAVSLVNFPAIKGMNPVADLGEETHKHIYLTRGGLEMSKNDLIASLAESIVEKVKEKLVAETGAVADAAVEAAETDTTPETTTSQQQNLGEDVTNEELLLYVEGMVEEKLRPIVAENANLRTRLTESATQVGQLMTERRQAALRARLSEVTKLGPGKAYAPKVLTAMEKVLQAEPAAQEDEFFKLLEALKGKDAVVDLGEAGVASTSEFDGPPVEGSPAYQALLDKKAKEYQNEKRVSYSEAVRQVARQLAAQ